MSTERIERALARLGAEREPPEGWQDRVLGAIAAERVEGALARLGAEREPRPGWQARVMAAIEEKPKRRWWWYAIPALAAAAVALVVLWPRTKSFELALEIEQSGQVVRSQSVSIGSTLHASARGGGAHRAVWVYRNQASLALACPGSPSCRETSDATIADLTLELPGTYAVVAITSKAPIAAPTGSYDADLAALERAGIERKIEQLDVR